MKKCYVCEKIKNLSEFGKNKRYKDGLQLKCKACTSIYMNDYFNNHKQNRKDRYYTPRKRDIIVNISNRTKERRKTDPLFDLLCSLRSRIRSAFFGKNKSKRTIDLLGCSISEASKYIESLFKPGMSWENRVLWEIDHKNCLGSARNVAELESFCHYTNLQPMWKSEHIIKTVEDVRKIKALKNNKL